jgi:hypothetical protein
MGIRLRVRGPDSGGYHLFLDDHEICTGISANEAARYIRDAWLFGAQVFPEYLNPAGGVDAVLQPQVISALEARDLASEAPGGPY